MQVDTKLIRLVKALYNNPTFAVKIKGIKSDYMSQERGIRQGCPVSPYLFLILMAVLFTDVHRECDRRIAWHRMRGVGFSEILYADDTVLLTDNARAMNVLIRSIENNAHYYGLTLDKDKCGVVKMNANNNTANSALIMNILHTWWETENVPDSMLQALVASLYKKREPKNLENYPPISLLNSLLKVFAGIPQTRIEAGVDKELQAIQYGF